MFSWEKNQKHCSIRTKKLHKMKLKKKDIMTLCIIPGVNKVKLHNDKLETAQHAKYLRKSSLDKSRSSFCSVEWSGQACKSGHPFILMFL